MKFFALRCSALIWIYIGHYIYITDNRLTEVENINKTPGIIQWWDGINQGEKDKRLLPILATTFIIYNIYIIK